LRAKVTSHVEMILNHSQTRRGILFVNTTYTKQLLAGIHHRDWETFSAFMSQMLFGGLFYAAQQVVNSFGMADRDEYLEKRLAPDAIARASFQRAGFSSILPPVIDTAAQVGDYRPVFDFRTSDMSGAIWGNPTADLLNNARHGLRALIAPAARDDYDFSQQDLCALTSLFMFQNAFVIRNGLAMAGAELPRFSN
ncbi:hypothetical protein, partial [Paracoccus binzhouensis]|uniref:hypothetical protein n=1 Tax=Paracoccus binzhouensis TaxID=2796149 RepID=UPI0018EF098B